jgi:hypothetical protein
MPAPKRPPPPAPKGNQRALRHGAHAKPPVAKVKATEQLIYDALAQAAPVREHGDLPPADAAMVHLTAKTLARLQSVSDWLDEHGSLDKKGKVRSAALHEQRLTSKASKLLAALGMSPAARVKIGAQLAASVDLSMALSEPDPVRRAALMQQAGLGAASPTGGETLQE